MDDAILPDNDRKAELSFAYLAALGVYAGSLLSHRLSNEGGLNLPCLVE